MNTNLRVIEENYYADPEKGVVVCILTCNLQIDKHPAQFELYGMLSASPSIKTAPNGDFKVRAVAKCHDTDLFDYEVGRRIAESRAKYKAFGIAERFYKRVYKHYRDKVLKPLALSIEACEMAGTVESAHLYKLLRDS